jgi:transcriptional regulator with XRE-family HTH domain
MQPDTNINVATAGTTISETLTRLRIEKGLTPMQVAKLSGVNLLTINLYENPYYEQYEIKTLTRIVEVCGGKLTLSISSAKS